MPRKFVLCACMLLFMLALSACGGEASSTGTVISSSPGKSTAIVQVTKKPIHWATTHTFTGNGAKKTATFTVSDDWKIVWSCNPTSFGGMDYNLIVLVSAPSGGMVDSGINTMCKKTNTHDVDEVHAGGQVFLDINSEGDWTIQVQELK